MLTAKTTWLYQAQTSGENDYNSQCNLGVIMHTSVVYFWTYRMLQQFLHYERLTCLNIFIYYN